MKSKVFVLAAVGLVVGLSAFGKGGTGIVAGKVLLLDTGKPIADVTLQLLETELGRLVPVGGLAPAYEVKTDKRGRFEFRGVPEGTWYVGVRDQTMAPVSYDVEVDLGKKRKVKGLEIHVVEGASIEGGVYSDIDFEKGVPNLVLSLVNRDYRPNRTERCFRTTTDSAGKFRLGGIPSGGYSLGPAPQQPYFKCSNVFMDDTAFFQDVIFIREKRQLTKVEFQVAPSFKVTGVVLDRDGAPATGAELSTFRSDYETDWFQASARAEDGKFTLTSLEEPEGTLQARYGKLMSKPTPYSAVPAARSKDSELCVLRLVRPSRVRGQVVDRNGNPMPLAELRLTQWCRTGGSETWSLKLDENARFASHRLFGGTYSFNVPDYNRVYGFESFETDKFELADEQTIDNHRIVVETVPKTDEPGETDNLTISGTVRDFDGKPLSGAKLVLIRKYDQCAGETKAASDGSYTIRAPHSMTDESRKSLDLICAAPGHNRGSLKGVLPGSVDNDFALAVAPTLRVIVVEDRTGRPVPKFAIEAVDKIGEDRLAPHLNCRIKENIASEDGLFQTKLPASTWELTVNAKSFMMEHKTRIIAPESTAADIEFRMKKPAALNGRVLSARGKPIPGVDVAINCTDDHKKESYQPENTLHIITDHEGRFSADNLYPGPATLRFHHPKHSTGSEERHLEAGERNITEIVLDERAAIAGRVTVGGKPLPGVAIGDRSYAVTDESGEYSIEELDCEIPGILAGWEDCGLGQARYLMRDVNVVSGETVTVDFDYVPGTSGLRGAFTLDGEPSRASIFTRFYYPSGQTEDIYLNTLQDGTYSFKKLPHGDAVVLFRAQKRTLAQAVTFPNNAVLELDCDLSAGVTVSGTVEGPVNSETDSVRVLLGSLTPADFDKDPLTVMDPRYITGSRIQEGAFSVENVCPGTYTLAVVRWTEGRETRSKNVLTTQVVEVGSLPLENVKVRVPNTGDSP